MTNIDISRKIILAFGISILIGASLGYLLSNEKYYYMHPQKPKREITKMLYEKRSENRDVIKKEKVYNQEIAILTGVVSFGACLIMIALIKPKRISD